MESPNKIMKNLLILLCWLPLLATAQITNVNLGSSPTDPTRDTFAMAWNKLNANDNWLSGQIASAITSINALTNPPALPTNIVQSSFANVLTNINPLTFTGSNYIGHFSQLFSFQLVTPEIGGGGSVPPTNQFEQVVVSYNGSTWWALTNANGVAEVNAQADIFQGVYVAVVGVAANSGALILWGLNQTNLYNRTNSLAGQVTQVATPVNPNDIATKQYVDYHSGTVSPWYTSLDTNSMTHCSYGYNGGLLADLASSSAWVRIDSLVADSTGTNLLLGIAQTNLAPGWKIYAQTNLATALAGWPVCTNYTVVTNSGEVTFTIPINFNLSAQFFLCQATGTNYATFTEPVTMPGLQLTSFTVTHSTNSTAGIVMGAIYCDTNYLYQAVASNRWLRIAWPTNTW